MALPLLILAVPAVIAGFFNIGGGFSHLVEGALPDELRHGAPDIYGGIVAVSLVMAFGGIGAAAAIYHARRPSAEEVRAKLGPLPGVVEAKYYLDFIAETVIVRWILNGVIQRAAQLVDTYIIDFAVDQFAESVRRAGDAMRRVEAGYVQGYTSLFLAGVVIAVVVIAVLGTGVLER
ncbi:MAG: hypothetical protein F4Y96_01315 [Chloroflexi bacterium]|nr:hypothetical protein [Chloroflexota bacterium]